MFITDVNNRRVEIEITGTGINTGIDGLNAAAELYGIEGILGHVAKVRFDGSDALTNLAGTSDDIKRAVLGRNVEEVSEIILDCAINAQGENHMATGEGTVIVYLSGGMDFVRVPVVGGQTTVYETVHSEAVKNRTRFTDEDLINHIIMVNDEVVQDAVARTTRVYLNDSIMITPRIFHKHG